MLEALRPSSIRCAGQWAMHRCRWSDPTSRYQLVSCFKNNCTDKVEFGALALRSTSGIPSRGMRVRITRQRKPGFGPASVRVRLGMGRDPSAEDNTDPDPRQMVQVVVGVQGNWPKTYDRHAAFAFFIWKSRKCLNDPSTNPHIPTGPADAADKAAASCGGCGVHRLTVEQIATAPKCRGARCIAISRVSWRLAAPNVCWPTPYGSMPWPKPATFLPRNTCMA